jgi:DNA-binding sugar fermentation-stimulating protein
MLVEDTLLMKLDNLIEGQIIKRPSLYIKSPYVADVSIDDETKIIAHTASLGCCGLADVNASVLLTISSNNKKSVPKNKANLRCTHTIYLSILKFNDDCCREQIIGIHPKLAETLVENALNKNLLKKLINVRRYKRETSIYIKDKVDSRFDFTGVDSDGIPFIMEVKNVPLADYEDVSIVDRKKMDFTGRDINSKVAYFPDGYRKKTTDTVSPRALKHISELTTIKRESAIRCIMCYVIQRTDVNRFQPSVIDPEYRNAFKLALESGVEIITMVVSWNREGEAIFVRDDLPISI